MSIRWEGGGMHSLIPIQFDLVEKSNCKPTFTVVAVDDQLSDPANSPATDRPSAGESVTSKMTVDGDSNI
jgi:hypothetical protein